jgi:hypothetical protein
MRHILSIAAIALVGCGSIANTAFDNVEASRYADIATMAHGIQEGCKDTAGVRAISFTLMALAQSAYHYSDVKANNKRAAEAGQIIYSFTVDLNTRYQKGDPSEAYCKLKLGTIEQAADITARSISKKELVSPFAIP